MAAAVVTQSPGLVERFDMAFAHKTAISGEQRWLVIERVIQMAHDLWWVLQVGDRVCQLLGQAGRASKPSCDGAAGFQAFTDRNDITRTAPT